MIFINKIQTSDFLEQTLVPDSMLFSIRPTFSRFLPRDRRHLHKIDVQFGWQHLRDVIEISANVHMCTESMRALAVVRMYDAGEQWS